MSTSYSDDRKHNPIGSVQKSISFSNNGEENILSEEQEQVDIICHSP